MKPLKFFNDETNFETNQELLSMRFFLVGHWLKAGQETTFTPKMIEKQCNNSKRISVLLKRMLGRKV